MRLSVQPVTLYQLVALVQQRVPGTDLCRYSRYSCASYSCSVLFKKALGSAVSDEIWQDCSKANTRRLTESDFRFDVTLSRWRPLRHFTQQSAATCELRRSVCRRV